MTDSTPLLPSSSAKPDEHKLGAISSYAITLNFILGVGILGIPYSFYRSGIVLGIITLAIVSVFAFVTAMWLPDVVLRASLLKLHSTSPRSDSDLPLQPSSVQHAQWSTSVLDHQRSPMEMNELVGFFLGRRPRLVYEFCICLYFVGALWSYSSVFASSFASHVALPHINGGSTCKPSDDHSSGCTGLYLIYLAIFSSIVIPLTCLEVTETKSVQVALAALRFVAVGAMVGSSIHAIQNYPNPDLHTTKTSPPYYSDIRAFDWSGLSVVFPTAIYAQIFHHSVPGLVHPLKDKAKSPAIFSCVLLSTTLLYSSLGAAVGLYYGSSTEQTCSLNWASYTGGHEHAPGWATFLSYLIVLFPPLDVISAFPLNAQTLSNNIMVTLIKDPRKQTDRRFLSLSLSSPLWDFVAWTRAHSPL